MSCDCPACQRLCQRTGRKCFVPCVQCISTVEYDAVGALTSRTVVLGRAPPSIYSDDFWHRVAREAAIRDIIKEGEA